MTADPAPAPACARCGRDAQYDFDELWLCLDCYHVAGSTCAGVQRPSAAAQPVPNGAVDSARPGSTSAGIDPVC